MSVLRAPPVFLAVALALCLAPSSPASACSEGLFNTGKGLAYQGYLAPRPARVLIFAPTPAAESANLLAGLQKAGHRVDTVADAAALAAALAAEHYDVVITGLDNVGAVAGTDAGAPRVLPVVARAQRGSAQVRERFSVFVVDGASLGQYLRSINRLLDAGR